MEPLGGGRIEVKETVGDDFSREAIKTFQGKVIRTHIYECLEAIFL
jgi:hypothetical protein